MYLGEGASEQRLDLSFSSVAQTKGAAAVAWLSLSSMVWRLVALGSGDEAHRLWRECDEKGAGGLFCMDRLRILTYPTVSGCIPHVSNLIDFFSGKWNFL